MANNEPQQAAVQSTSATHNHTPPAAPMNTPIPVSAQNIPPATLRRARNAARPRCTSCHKLYNVMRICIADTCVQCTLNQLAAPLAPSNTPGGQGPVVVPRFIAQVAATARNYLRTQDPIRSLAIPNDDLVGYVLQDMKRDETEMMRLLIHPAAAAGSDFNTAQKARYDTAMLKALDAVKAALTAPDGLRKAHAQMFSLIEEAAKVHSNGVPESELLETDARYLVDDQSIFTVRIQRLKNIIRDNKIVCVDLLNGERLNIMSQRPDNFSARRIQMNDSNKRRDDLYIAGRNATGGTANVGAAANTTTAPPATQPQSQAAQQQSFAALPIQFHSSSAGPSLSHPASQTFTHLPPTGLNVHPGTPTSHQPSQAASPYSYTSFDPADDPKDTLSTEVSPDRQQPDQGFGRTGASSGYMRQTMLTNAQGNGKRREMADGAFMPEAEHASKRSRIDGGGSTFHATTNLLPQLEQTTTPYGSSSRYQQHLTSADRAMPLNSDSWEPQSFTGQHYGAGHSMQPSEFAAYNTQDRYDQFTQPPNPASSISTSSYANNAPFMTSSYSSNGLGPLHAVNSGSGGRYSFDATAGLGEHTTSYSTARETAPNQINGASPLHRSWMNRNPSLGLDSNGIDYGHATPQQFPRTQGSMGFSDGFHPLRQDNGDGNGGPFERRQDLDEYADAE